MANAVFVGLADIGLAMVNMPMNGGRSISGFAPSATCRIEINSRPLGSKNSGSLRGITNV